MSDARAVRIAKASAEGTYEPCPTGDRLQDLPPLCVDLDGTLVRSDTLVEGVLVLACTRTGLWQGVKALFRGRAAFKARVAQLAQLDAALLPYDEDVLRYLRDQKSAGRKLVLATGADIGVAQAVAKHLGLFDEVMASDGARNLKGKAKADALDERFSESGFAYAGNARSDMAIWRVARSGVIVNSTRAVRASAREAAAVEAEIDNRTSPWRAALRAMRPHQWVKNVLVFVPILTAHAPDETSAWIGGVALFVAFCAAASGIYIINDVADIAADRQHPNKRHRPFASGALSIPPGLCLSALLLVFGLGIAAAIGTLPIIAIYVAIAIAYSLWLKTFPLLDVFLLAALYTIRLFGGGVATGHLLSFWLLGFSVFLFLSLALAKRVGELLAMARSSSRAADRRGYRSDDVLILQTFGCAAAFASCVVLALFVQSSAASQEYAAPGLLWGIVPLMLFWECRIWLSTARGDMCDDPIVFAARDWVTRAVIVAATALLSVASAGVPFSW